MRGSHFMTANHGSWPVPVYTPQHPQIPTATPYLKCTMGNALLTPSSLIAGRSMLNSLSNDRGLSTRKRNVLSTYPLPLDFLAEYPNIVLVGVRVLLSPRCPRISESIGESSVRDNIPLHDDPD